MGIFETVMRRRSLRAKRGNPETRKAWMSRCSWPAGERRWADGSFRCVTSSTGFICVEVRLLEKLLDDRQDDVAEDRRRHRSKLFLAATIEAAGTKCPVRIRDLSESGALLEGAAFPAQGTILTLRRQEVEISAKVVWLSAPRCGVAFEGAISVAEWIAGKPGAPSFGQQRVDAIQATVRRGVATSSDLAVPSELEPGNLDDIDRRLAEELTHVRRLLEAISDELVDDPAIVDRHLTALQTFDTAGQILGHVANILTAEDREAAIKMIGMDELRARLLRRRAR